MSLSARLFRNTVANYIGTFIGLIVALLLVPYTINTLGSTQYGVWAITMSAFGWLALIDFGLANALAKYTAEYATREDHQTVEKMVSTLFFVFAVTGLILFLGTVWLSFNFARFFSIPSDYAHTAQLAIIILGLNTALGLPLSVYNALTVGYQRYEILNLIIGAGQLLNAGLTVLVLTLGWDLIGLALTVLAVTVAKALLLRWLLRRWASSSVRIRLSFVSRSLLKVLVSYSVFMFVMMISRQIEANAGPVIVGRLIGLADVTVYAVGVKISVLVRQFTFPMAVALFPAFSELNALDDRARLAVLLTQGLRASALVGMPLAGITIILARPLISIWVGPQFVDAARIATVMTLQVLVLQQMLATSSLLTGIGKLRLYALLHVLAMLFSVAFALFLAPRWGSLAVALGSLLAWGGVLLVTMPYTAQLATVRLGDLFEKSLLRPLAATSVMCLGLFILRSWHYPATLPALLGQVSAAGLVYLFLAWNYCFNAAERKVYLNSVRKVILGLSPISS